MTRNPRTLPNLKYGCSDHEAPPESQEHPYHKTPSMEFPGLANVTESEHQSKFPEEYVVPQRSSWADIPREHLTIRERYAMAAMQGMLSNPNLDIRESGANWICDRAWEVAEEQIQWQDYDAQKRMERAFRKEEIEAGEDEELSERDVDGFDKIRRVNRTLASLRSKLERESAEHFATRIALRDALRDGAAYAREAADYAADRSEPEYAETAREDAAQWDAARAALGLDEITMPAAAGETAAAHFTTSPLAEAIDKQIMGEATAATETAYQGLDFSEEPGRAIVVPVKPEPAAPDPAPAKPERKPFRAGDIVHHRKSNEDWVLACDEFDEYVIPAGWPESTAPASECELITAASDDDRIKMLERAARSEGLRGSRAARQLLEAITPTPNPVPPATAPEPARRRRRFLAGDRVRLPAQTTVHSTVLDENDAGSVAIEVSRNELNCISTSALTLIEPTHRARRNRELAFHFHRWSISTDTDAMDSVPEFVRVAAEQLLRDPFGTEYGTVLTEPKTGGAK